MTILADILLVVSAFAAMEAVAWAAHKYLMHGPGWAWHQSHHEPHQGWFEINDLYALVFAGLAVALFFGATPLWPPLFWIAVGITAYGLAYALVHDGLVHQRWPFRHTPRNAYLKRLVQAHRLHHAVEGREHCVSFGFLYAPPIRALKQTIVRLHPRGLRNEAAE